VRLDSVLTPEDKKMRLPWWGVSCWMICCALIALLLLNFGKFDLARPMLCSTGVLVAVIAMRWKLRRNVWFWITVAVITALHVPLILFVPWTTKWVPAIVIIPVGIADLYLMLAILSVVGGWVKGPKKVQS
jgi:hypothetical protein